MLIADFVGQVKKTERARDVSTRHASVEKTLEKTMVYSGARTVIFARPD
jgi:hypothetical protein